MIDFLVNKKIKEMNPEFEDLFDELYNFLDIHFFKQESKPVMFSFEIDDQNQCSNFNYLFEDLGDDRPKLKPLLQSKEKRTKEVIDRIFSANDYMIPGKTQVIKVFDNWFISILDRGV